MIKRISSLIFTFILCLTTGCESGKPETFRDKDQHRIQSIDSLFNSQYEQNRFHGGVVISHFGETLYENYLGLADRSWNLPVHKTVKFDIASVNKSMIAALTLKAVEQDQLQLENKLVDLLADFSFEGEFHAQITLHHLLSHSAGLPDYDGVGDNLKQAGFLKLKRLRFNNAEYVNFISQLEPVSGPGQQFYYSNFAYHLLAIILEETYERPFGEILRVHLSRPLGLKHTVSESRNEVIISHLAQAYNYREETGEWQQTPFIDLSLGRRIFSTASDLNRWAQVMDNPGYLSASSLELMQTNHLMDISQTVEYGYGWVVLNGESEGKFGDLGISRPYIIHGGSTDGYKAMLININQGEYAISFLSNVGNQTQEMQLAQSIVKLLIK